MAANFPNNTQIKGQKSKRQKLVFWKPNLKSVIQLLLLYPFIRSKSLDSTYTQGEEIKPGHEYQEAAITGGHLRGCLPECLSLRVCIYKSVSLSLKLYSILK